jgi:hypothetical protein
MKILISAIAALATLVSGGASKPSLWKGTQSDSVGVPQWTDSLAYDGKGKLLAECRRDPAGHPIHTVQYLYDDSGRGEKAIKTAPDGRISEQADCGYGGKKLTSWMRTEDGITMDGISFHKADNGDRIAYVQVALSAGTPSCVWRTDGRGSFAASMRKGSRRRSSVTGTDPRAS